jgi:hypothetical protein
LRIPFSNAPQYFLSQATHGICKHMPTYAYIDAISPLQPYHSLPPIYIAQNLRILPLRSTFKSPSSPPSSSNSRATRFTHLNQICFACLLSLLLHHPPWTLFGPQGSCQPKHGPKQTPLPGTKAPKCDIYVCIRVLQSAFARKSFLSDCSLTKSGLADVNRVISAINSEKDISKFKPSWV